MQNTTFAQWRAWARDYNYLPFVARFPLANLERLNERGNLLSWEPVWLAAGGDCAFVLESGKRGRYTIVGLHPQSVCKGWLTGSAGAAESPTPLAALSEWMRPLRAPVIDACPDLPGGCVGYLSYDVARTLERLPQSASDDLQLPAYYFARYDALHIIDHESKQLICLVHTNLSQTTDDLSSSFTRAQARAEQLKKQWDEWTEQAYALGSARRRLFATDCHAVLSEPADGAADAEATGMQRSFTEQQFVTAVRAVQDYIGAGDVFQVNLSVRQSRPLTTAATDIYEWLRLLNPSPYMGFLKFPEFDIVCGSPELLVKLENGRLTTRPIAGTRPRGSDREHDGELAAELILNEKECAEHIMLVDLERNDLGRVARAGTVRVSDLMAIEKYSHVMHIVSQVEAELRPELDAFAAIAATFPGGTITGAPKIRTMEIIDELEPVRRGPYTGSLGWLDCNGNLQLNIIIRTLIAHNGWAHVQAGAGIVSDSVPEKEYVESLNKAQALWTAVRLSEQMRIGVD